jgi:MFS family permease
VIFRQRERTNSLEQKETDKITVTPDESTQSQAKAYHEPTKIWNALFINVVIVNIAMNFGQFMMNTLISKFADYLGAAATVVGIVTSIFTVTALAVKPISGPAIDTFPKKRILVGAILTIMAAFITYSLAQDVTTIIIARLIHGMGMGFTASTCLALASDALPKSKLTQGISYFTLGQAVVSAVGPTIGLSLAARFGYNKAFAIGAVMMGCSAVLAAFMKTPPITKKKKFTISLNNMFAVEAVIPAVLQLFLAMSYGTISSFLVL